MLNPPDTPVGDPFVSALETCRRFLLATANAAMPAHLAPKGGASDLVQETIVAGYLRQHQFRGRTLAELRAWLRSILLHELADFRRRFRASCRDVAREVPVGALAAGPSHPAAADPALDSLIRDERVRALGARLARLPADTREVLVLRVGQKLGFREIGERLGRTEDAARKTFTRAIERLREAARGSD